MFYNNTNSNINNNSAYGSPVYQQSQQSQSSLRNNSTQLWMGELDPFWDEGFIKAIWNSFGFPQTNVKLIKDPKMSQGYNAGYCFVEFPNLEDASNALSKNGSRIPNTNKSLKLNWASGGSNSNNNNNNNHSGQQNNRSNEISIFVGDLAPDVNDSSLFEFFGTKYSSVSGTKIMIDQQTGQSKGYGFVRFLNESEQQRALVEMQGAILNGRPIRVSTAVPKSRQQNQFQRFSNTNNNNNLHNQHQQSPSSQLSQLAPQLQNTIPMNAQSQQILGSLEAQYQPPLTQFTDPNNTTVFIGGLSSIVTEEDLRLYFQPFGDITYVKIPIGKGCGFVQYTTRASAELAISKMQGYPIGNSRIRLSWGRSNANPKPQSYQQQHELPMLYGFQNQVGGQIPLSNAMIPQQSNTTDSNSSINGIDSAIPGVTGEYGQSIMTNQNQFQADPSENIDQSRLNQLYMAARDGRLDAIESASNGYIFA